MKHLIRDLIRRGRKERGPAGIVDGHLRDCPNSPNCVSSQAAGSANRLPFIKVHGPAEDVIDRIESILEGWPRTQIVTREGPYLHAVCSTAGLGFEDDVEFLVSSGEGRLDYRSASRIGYSDLGANRRRMQLFVREFGDGENPVEP